MPEKGVLCVSCVRHVVLSRWFVAGKCEIRKCSFAVISLVRVFFSVQLGIKHVSKFMLLDPFVLVGVLPCKYAYAYFE